VEDVHGHVKICVEGGLGVCLFLCVRGAGLTICTKSSAGKTPMWVTCFEGHFDVAK